MTPLRQKMIEQLRLRNYSTRTEEAYVSAVAHCARFFGRSPETLSPDEIQRYLLHLRDEKKASWSKVNQTVCGLKFFYRYVMGKPEKIVKKIPYQRREKRLPVILSVEEVARFLEAVEPTRYRVMLSLAYGTGLRTGELTHLELRDIDSRRMMIHVRRGKGHKDRYVPLTPRLLGMLRSWWKLEHPRELLFPSPRKGHPICEKTLTRACRVACSKAGIDKHVTPRTLRHTFATHMLEGGTDIRVIQTLLGHTSVSTTQIYTYVSDEKLRNSPSPLDRLDLPRSFFDPTR